LITSGIIPPTVADYITALEERSLENEVNKKETPRRGKNMSRRTGQDGHVEKSGNWWVVRYWEDVPGQEKRVHRRVKICPTAGPSMLSKSALKRRAREIIAASGADTQEHFERAVKMQPAECVTFYEQSEIWIADIAVRRRDPVAPATLERFGSALRKHLIPSIGGIPLRNINNAALKRVVAELVGKGLAPSSIQSITLVVKMVVKSAVNTEGEYLYPIKWNHKFIDFPRIVEEDLNRPVFTHEQVSFLAHWPTEWARVLFILLAATGLRIGEGLGIAIDKHISADFLTISIEQKIRKAMVETRLKTKLSKRKVDLHPIIAEVLRQFVGSRTSGLLFQTESGGPLSYGAVVNDELYPALEQLGYLNKHTGTSKAGNHAFRRYRTTYLLNETSCPPGLSSYWMGHRPNTMTEFYNMIKENDPLRREKAEECGFGFDLRSNVPVVPKTQSD
jgi:integrase